MGLIHTFLHCMIFVTVYSITGLDIPLCNTPQYLEIGRPGLINCSFQEDPLRVFWYRTLETTTENLIIKLWDSVKEEGNYDPGDFDILSNGSLQINNVSADHDGNFTFVTFRSLEYDPEQFAVQVITTVRPSILRPLIKGCSLELTVCILKSINISEVTCFVKEAKPPIALEWFSRTPYGEGNLASTKSISQQGITSTTVVTTSQVFHFTSVLSLLVCKADSIPQILNINDAYILLENNTQLYPWSRPVQKFVERKSKFVLECSEKKINMVVWKKSHELKNTFEPILYAAFFDKTVSVTRFASYELNSDGSLMVRHADVEHEGVYQCAYESDFSGDWSLYNVTIYVPGTPLVTGCNKYQYCVLGAEKEGSITCSVSGIRPLVHIEIGPFNEGDGSSIVFTDHETTVNSDSNLFDIRISMKYRMEEKLRERITLECRISATNTDVLTFSTKFDLLFTMDESKEPGFLLVPLLLAPLGVLILIGLLIAVYTFRGRKKAAKAKVHENEEVPMMSVPPSEVTIKEKRRIFLKQIKGKYADLYNAVQPIPYIRDRLLCVDRVFVEGGLEMLVSGEAAIAGISWESLKSYHDIFKNPRFNSSRKMIEGEPGYGKSTLTLQLAYDWCNRTSTSHLKDVDILILLRLRQLGGLKSIYRAIRQFCLPRDSLLTETDIESIISITPSTMIVLDGYDEYPDKEHIESDVNRVISTQMFQDFEVILTTRSSCLPHSYSAQTNRVRLTGFDSNARDIYIKKAVVGNDLEAASKILQRLRDNSLLADLCQVPLLFVMYAHMSHESKDALCFNSVTSFFHHMIACFHSHMFNKMQDDNVRRYKLFEKNHQKLDELAFEGLTGKNQKIVWPKKQIKKRVGEDFYDQYIRTGILIEEDVLDITCFSDSKEHGLKYRRLEVRFYHKLFAEWYAAYSLAARCKYLPVWRLKKVLRYVDPCDLQYFFRFASGLSPKAAEKIINHLHRREEGEKFAVLCILEKTGDVNDMYETIRDLCFNVTAIKNDDRTLHGSTIQLLEIAAGNQISISCVYLDNCYSTVDLLDGNHLQLKSNFSIPVLSTLNKLVLDTAGEGREITSEECTGILQYSSKCLTLKQLVFAYCLLPPSVQVESASVLISRNIKVTWVPISWDTEYELNLQSYSWEYAGRKTGGLSDEDYQTVVRDFRAKWQSA